MTMRPDMPRARTSRRPRRSRRADPASNRREAASLSGVNVLAGLWLAVSPWILGFTDDAIWNNLIFGGAITLFALARGSGARASGLSWTNLLIGSWVFATGFWLYDSSTAEWNSVITGAVVMLFSVWSAAASEGQRGRPGASPRGDPH